MDPKIQQFYYTKAVVPPLRWKCWGNGAGTRPPSLGFTITDFSWWQKINFVLCNSWGDRSITAKSPNNWRNASKLFGELNPSSTPGLLSLTSGCRKNKRAELDDRRLTLCHEKVGGQKH